MTLQLEDQAQIDAFLRAGEVLWRGDLKEFNSALFAFQKWRKVHVRIVGATICFWKDAQTASSGAKPKQVLPISKDTACHFISHAKLRQVFKFCVEVATESGVSFLSCDDRELLASFQRVVVEMTARCTRAAEVVEKLASPEYLEAVRQRVLQKQVKEQEETARQMISEMLKVHLGVSTPEQSKSPGGSPSKESSLATADSSNITLTTEAKDLAELQTNLEGLGFKARKLRTARSGAVGDDYDAIDEEEEAAAELFDNDDDDEDITKPNAYASEAVGRHHRGGSNSSHSSNADGLSSSRNSPAKQQEGSSKTGKATSSKTVTTTASSNVADTTSKLLRTAVAGVRFLSDESGYTVGSGDRLVVASATSAPPSLKRIISGDLVGSSVAGQSSLPGAHSSNQRSSLEQSQTLIGLELDRLETDPKLQLLAAQANQRERDQEQAERLTKKSGSRKKRGNQLSSFFSKAGEDDLGDTTNDSEDERTPILGERVSNEAMESVLDTLETSFRSTERGLDSVLTLGKSSFARKKLVRALWSIGRMPPGAHAVVARNATIDPQWTRSAYMELVILPRTKVQGSQIRYWRRIQWALAQSILPHYSLPVYRKPATLVLIAEQLRKIAQIRALVLQRSKRLIQELKTTAEFSEDARTFIAHVWDRLIGGNKVFDNIDVNAAAVLRAYILALRVQARAGAAWAEQHGLLGISLGTPGTLATMGESLMRGTLDRVFRSAMESFLVDSPGPLVSGEVVYAAQIFAHARRQRDRVANRRSKLNNANPLSSSLAGFENISAIEPNFVDVINAELTRGDLVVGSGGLFPTEVGDAGTNSTSLVPTAASSPILKSNAQGTSSVPCLTVAPEATAGSGSSGEIAGEDLWRYFPPPSIAGIYHPTARLGAVLEDDDGRSNKHPVAGRARQPLAQSDADITSFKLGAMGIANVLESYPVGEPSALPWLGYVAGGSFGTQRVPRGFQLPLLPIASLNHAEYILFGTTQTMSYQQRSIDWGELALDIPFQLARRRFSSGTSADNGLEVLGSLREISQGLVFTSSVHNAKLRQGERYQSKLLTPFYDWQRSNVDMHIPGGKAGAVDGVGAHPIWVRRRLASAILAALQSSAPEHFKELLDTVNRSYQSAAAKAPESKTGHSGNVAEEIKEVFGAAAKGIIGAAAFVVGKATSAASKVSKAAVSLAGRVQDSISSGSHVNESLMSSPSVITLESFTDLSISDASAPLAQRLASMYKSLTEKESLPYEKMFSVTPVQILKAIQAIAAVQTAVSRIMRKASSSLIDIRYGSSLHIQTTLHRLYGQELVARAGFLPLLGALHREAPVKRFGDIAGLYALLRVALARKFAGQSHTHPANIQLSLLGLDEDGYTAANDRDLEEMAQSASLSREEQLVLGSVLPEYLARGATSLLAPKRGGLTQVAKLTGGLLTNDQGGDQLQGLNLQAQLALKRFKGKEVSSALREIIVMDPTNPISEDDKQVSRVLSQAAVSWVNDSISSDPDSTYSTHSTSKTNDQSGFVEVGFTMGGKGSWTSYPLTFEQYKQLLETRVKEGKESRPPPWFSLPLSYDKLAKQHQAPTPGHVASTLYEAALALQDEYEKLARFLQPTSVVEPNVDDPSQTNAPEFFAEPVIVALRNELNLAPALVDAAVAAGTEVDYASRFAKLSKAGALSAALSVAHAQASNPDIAADPTAPRPHAICAPTVPPVTAEDARNILVHRLTLAAAATMKPHPAAVFTALQQHQVMSQTGGTTQPSERTLNEINIGHAAATREEQVDLARNMLATAQRRLASGEGLETGVLSLTIRNENDTLERTRSLIPSAQAFVVEPRQIPGAAEIASTLGSTSVPLLPGAESTSSTGRAGTTNSNVPYLSPAYAAPDAGVPIPSKDPLDICRPSAEPYPAPVPPIIPAAYRFGLARSALDPWRALVSGGLVGSTQLAVLERIWAGSRTAAHLVQQAAVAIQWAAAHEQARSGLALIIERVPRANSRRNLSRGESGLQGHMQLDSVRISMQFGDSLSSPSIIAAVSCLYAFQKTMTGTSYLGLQGHSVAKSLGEAVAGITAGPARYAVVPLTKIQERDGLSVSIVAKISISSSTLSPGDALAIAKSLLPKTPAHPALSPYSVSGSDASIPDSIELPSNKAKFNIQQFLARSLAISPKAEVSLKTLQLAYASPGLLLLHSPFRNAFEIPRTCAWWSLARPELVYESSSQDLLAPYLPQHLHHGPLHSPGQHLSASSRLSIAFPPRAIQSSTVYPLRLVNRAWRPGTLEATIASVAAVVLAALRPPPTPVEVAEETLLAGAAATAEEASTLTEIVRLVQATRTAVDNAMLTAFSQVASARIEGGFKTTSDPLGGLNYRADIEDGSYPTEITEDESPKAIADPSEMTIAGSEPSVAPLEKQVRKDIERFTAIVTSAVTAGAAAAATTSMLATSSALYPPASNLAQLMGSQPQPYEPYARAMSTWAAAQIHRLPSVVVGDQPGSSSQATQAKEAFDCEALPTSPYSPPLLAPPLLGVSDQRATTLSSSDVASAIAAEAMAALKCHPARDLPLFRAALLRALNHVVKSSESATHSATVEDDDQGDEEHGDRSSMTRRTLTGAVYLSGILHPISPDELTRPLESAAYASTTTIPPSGLARFSSGASSLQQWSLRQIAHVAAAILSHIDNFHAKYNPQLRECVFNLGLMRLTSRTRSKTNDPLIWTVAPESKILRHCRSALIEWVGSYGKTSKRIERKMKERVDWSKQVLDAAEHGAATSEYTQEHLCRKIEASLQSKGLDLENAIARALRWRDVVVNALDRIEALRSNIVRQEEYIRMTLSLLELFVLDTVPVLRVPSKLKELGRAGDDQPAEAIAIPNYGTYSLKRFQAQHLASVYTTTLDKFAQLILENEKLFRAVRFPHTHSGGGSPSHEDSPELTPEHPNPESLRTALAALHVAHWSACKSVQRRRRWVRRLAARLLTQLDTYTPQPGAGTRRSKETLQLPSQGKSLSGQLDLSQVSSTSSSQILEVRLASSLISGAHADVVSAGTPLDASEDITEEIASAESSFLTSLKRIVNSHDQPGIQAVVKAALNPFTNPYIQNVTDAAASHQPGSEATIRQRLRGWKMGAQTRSAEDDDFSSGDEDDDPLAKRFAVSPNGVFALSDIWSETGCFGRLTSGCITHRASDTTSGTHNSLLTCECYSDSESDSSASDSDEIVSLTQAKPTATGRTRRKASARVTTRSAVVSDDENEELPSSRTDKWRSPRRYLKPGGSDSNASSTELDSDDSTSSDSDEIKSARVQKSRPMRYQAKRNPRADAPAMDSTSVGHIPERYAPKKWMRRAHRVLKQAMAASEDSAPGSSYHTLKMGSGLHLFEQDPAVSTNVNESTIDPDFAIYALMGMPAHPSAAKKSEGAKDSTLDTVISQVRGHVRDLRSAASVIRRSMRRSRHLWSQEKELPDGTRMPIPVIPPEHLFAPEAKHSRLVPPSLVGDMVDQSRIMSIPDPHDKLHALETLFKTHLMDLATADEGRRRVDNPFVRDPSEQANPEVKTHAAVDALLENVRVPAEVSSAVPVDLTTCRGLKLPPRAAIVRSILDKVRSAAATGDLAAPGDEYCEDFGPIAPGQDLGAAGRRGERDPQNGYGERVVRLSTRDLISRVMLTLNLLRLLITELDISWPSYLESFQYASVTTVEDQRRLHDQGHVPTWAKWSPRDIHAASLALGSLFAELTELAFAVGRQTAIHTAVVPTEAAVSAATTSIARVAAGVAKDSVNDDLSKIQPGHPTLHRVNEVVSKLQDELQKQLYTVIPTTADLVESLLIGPFGDTLPSECGINLASPARRVLDGVEESSSCMSIFVKQDRLAKGADSSTSSSSASDIDANPSDPAMSSALDYYRSNLSNLGTNMPASLVMAYHRRLLECVVLEEAQESFLEDDDDEDVSDSRKTASDEDSNLDELEESSLSELSEDEGTKAAPKPRTRTSSGHFSRVRLKRLEAPRVSVASLHPNWREALSALRTTPGFGTCFADDCHHASVLHLLVMLAERQFNQRSVMIQLRARDGLAGVYEDEIDASHCRKVHQAILDRLGMLKGGAVTSIFSNHFVGGTNTMQPGGSGPGSTAPWTVFKRAVRAPKYHELRWPAIDSSVVVRSSAKMSISDLSALVGSTVITQHEPCQSQAWWIRSVTDTVRVALVQWLLRRHCLAPQLSNAALREEVRVLQSETNPFRDGLVPLPSTFGARTPTFESLHQKRRLLYSPDGPEDIFATKTAAEMVIVWSHSLIRLMTVLTAGAITPAAIRQVLANLAVRAITFKYNLIRAESIRYGKRRHAQRYTNELNRRHKILTQAAQVASAVVLHPKDGCAATNVGTTPIGKLGKDAETDLSAKELVTADGNREFFSRQIISQAYTLAAANGESFLRPVVDAGIMGLDPDEQANVDLLGTVSDEDEPTVGPTVAVEHDSAEVYDLDAFINETTDEEDEDDDGEEGETRRPFNDNVTDEADLVSWDILEDSAEEGSTSAQESDSPPANDSPQVESEDSTVSSSRSHSRKVVVGTNKLSTSFRPESKHDSSSESDGDVQRTSKQNSLSSRFQPTLKRQTSIEKSMGKTNLSDADLAKLQARLEKQLRTIFEEAPLVHEALLRSDLSARQAGRAMDLPSSIAPQVQEWFLPTHARDFDLARYVSSFRATHQLEFAAQQRAAGGVAALQRQKDTQPPVFAEFSDATFLDWHRLFVRASYLIHFEVALQLNIRESTFASGISTYSNQVLTGMANLGGSTIPIFAALFRADVDAFFSGHRPKLDVSFASLTTPPSSLHPYAPVPSQVWYVAATSEHYANATLYKVQAAVNALSAQYATPRGLLRAVEEDAKGLLQSRARDMNVSRSNAFFFESIMPVKRLHQLLVTAAPLIMLERYPNVAFSSNCLGKNYHVHVVNRLFAAGAAAVASAGEDSNFLNVRQSSAGGKFESITSLVGAIQPSDLALLSPGLTATFVGSLIGRTNQVADESALNSRRALDLLLPNLETMCTRWIKNWIFQRFETTRSSVVRDMGLRGKNWLPMVWKTLLPAKMKPDGTSAPRKGHVVLSTSVFHAITMLRTLVAEYFSNLEAFLPFGLQMHKYLDHCLSSVVMEIPRVALESSGSSFSVSARFAAAAGLTTATAWGNTILSADLKLPCIAASVLCASPAVTAARAAAFTLTALTGAVTPATRCNAIASVLTSLSIVDPAQARDIAAKAVFEGALPESSELRTPVKAVVDILAALRRCLSSPAALPYEVTDVAEPTQHRNQSASAQAPVSSFWTPIDNPLTLAHILRAQLHVTLPPHLVRIAAADSRTRNGLSLVTSRTDQVTRAMLDAVLASDPMVSHAMATIPACPLLERLTPLFSTRLIRSSARVISSTSAANIASPLEGYAGVESLAQLIANLSLVTRYGPGKFADKQQISEITSFLLRPEKEYGAVLLSRRRVKSLDMEFTIEQLGRIPVRSGPSGRCSFAATLDLFNASKFRKFARPFSTRPLLCLAPNDSTMELATPRFPTVVQRRGGFTEKRTPGLLGVLPFSIEGSLRPLAHILGQKNKDYVLELVARRVARQIRSADNEMDADLEVVSDAGESSSGPELVNPRGRKHARFANSDSDSSLTGSSTSDATSDSDSDSESKSDSLTSLSDASLQSYDEESTSDDLSSSSSSSSSGDEDDSNQEDLVETSPVVLPLVSIGRYGMSRGAGITNAPVNPKTSQKSRGDAFRRSVPSTKSKTPNNLSTKRQTGRTRQSATASKSSKVLTERLTRELLSASSSLALNRPYSSDEKVNVVPWYTCAVLDEDDDRDTDVRRRPHRQTNEVTLLARTAVKTATPPIELTQNIRDDIVASIYTTLCSGELPPDANISAFMQRLREYCAKCLQQLRATQQLQSLETSTVHHKSSKHASQVANELQRSYLEAASGLALAASLRIARAISIRSSLLQVLPHVGDNVKDRSAMESKSSSPLTQLFAGQNILNTLPTNVLRSSSGEVVNPLPIGKWYQFVPTFFWHYELAPAAWLAESDAAKGAKSREVVLQQSPQDTENRSLQLQHRVEDARMARAFTPGTDTRQKFSQALPDNNGALVEHPALVDEASVIIDAVASSTVSLEGCVMMEDAELLREFGVLSGGNNGPLAPSATTRLWSINPNDLPSTTEFALAPTTSNSSARSSAKSGQKRKLAASMAANEDKRAGPANDQRTYPGLEQVPLAVLCCRLGSATALEANVTQLVVDSARQFEKLLKTSGIKSNLLREKLIDIPLRLNRLQDAHLMAMRYHRATLRSAIATKIVHVLLSEVVLTLYLPIRATPCAAKSQEAKHPGFGQLLRVTISELEAFSGKQSESQQQGTVRRLIHAVSQLDGVFQEAEQAVTENLESKSVPALGLPHDTIIAQNASSLFLGTVFTTVRSTPIILQALLSILECLRPLLCKEDYETTARSVCSLFSGTLAQLMRLRLMPIDAIVAVSSEAVMSVNTNSGFPSNEDLFQLDGQAVSTAVLVNKLKQTERLLRRLQKDRTGSEENPLGAPALPVLQLPKPLRFQLRTSEANWYPCRTPSTSNSSEFGFGQPDEKDGATRAIQRLIQYASFTDVPQLPWLAPTLQKAAVTGRFKEPRENQTPTDELFSLLSPLNEEEETLRSFCRAWVAGLTGSGTSLSQATARTGSRTEFSISSTQGESPVAPLRCLCAPCLASSVAGVQPLPDACLGKNSKRSAGGNSVTASDSIKGCFICGSSAELDCCCQTLDIPTMRDLALGTNLSMNGTFGELTTSSTHYDEARLASKWSVFRHPALRTLVELEISTLDEHFATVIPDPCIRRLCILRPLLDLLIPHFDSTITTYFQ